MDRRAGLVAGMLVMACGPSVVTASGGGGDAASSDTAPATTSPEVTSTGDGPNDGPDSGPVSDTTESTTGTGVATFGDDSSGGGSSDGAAFISRPDGGGICGPLPDGTLAACECDVFAQDCPGGEKCIPWANDGGTVWNATRCSPVVDDPDGVGDPCTMMSSPVSGFDTCDAASMCFHVDPVTLDGICVAFCQAPESAPVCDAGTDCLLGDKGVLAVCLPMCDPLADGCGVGQRCLAEQSGLWCLPSGTASAGVGEACDSSDACEAGLACALGSKVGCADDHCCTPWCDLDLGDPNPACAAGQTCTPWFPVGEAPAGLEHVGVCSATG